MRSPLNLEGTNVSRETKKIRMAGALAMAVAAAAWAQSPPPAGRAQLSGTITSVNADRPPASPEKR